VPLARCPGCAGFPRRTDWAAVKPPSDSSLRVCLSFRVLPSETLSASRSLRTPLLDFGSLQHMLDSAIHKPRAFQARFGPRSGFGHPLRGFRPPNPRRLCFAPAALVGFALRSFLLQRGDRSVSARSRPHAVLPAGKRSARGGGPARQAAASGFRPASQSLAIGKCLAGRLLDAPVGFFLPRCSSRCLERGLTRSPPSRFSIAIPCGFALASAPEFRQHRPGRDRRP